jgi:hypothetical protein
MSQSLLDSISLLIRYQRVSPAVTKRFRSWKHNADIVPKLQTQLEMLLDAYGKFDTPVYDTQCIRDDGTDIALRLRDSESGPQLICFQAKSFDDLSKNTYLQDLKAQRDDSFRKVVGLQKYFIVLCTDMTVHQGRVRSIMAEFRSAQMTEVIEPAFAFTFLNQPKTRVDALVTRAMDKGDFVFRRAVESIELSSPSARALIIFMTVRAVLTNVRRFDIEELLGEAALRSVYNDMRDQQEALLSVDSTEEVESEEMTEKVDGDESDEYYDDQFVIKDFQSQVDEDLDLLDTDAVEIDSVSQTVVLRLNRLHPLSALITDALARYEYTSENALLAYMFSLMDVQA